MLKIGFRTSHVPDLRGPDHWKVLDEAVVRLMCVKNQALLTSIHLCRLWFFMICDIFMTGMLHTTRIISRFT